METCREIQTSFLLFFGGHSDGHQGPVALSSGNYHYYPELDCLIMRMIPGNISTEEIHRRWRGWYEELSHMTPDKADPFLSNLDQWNETEKTLYSIFIHEVVNHRQPFVQSSIGTVVGTVSFKANVAFAHWMQARRSGDTTKKTAAHSTLSHHSAVLRAVLGSAQVVLEALALGWDFRSLVMRFSVAGEKNPQAAAYDLMIQAIRTKPRSLAEMYSKALELAIRAIRITGMQGLSAIANYALNPSVDNHRAIDRSTLPARRFKIALQYVEGSKKSSLVTVEDIRTLVPDFDCANSSRTELLRHLRVTYPYVLETKQQFPSPDVFADPECEEPINVLPDLLLITDPNELSTTMRYKEEGDRALYLDHIYLTILRGQLIEGAEIDATPAQCPNYVLFGNCSECLRATQNHGPRVAHALFDQIGWDPCPN